MSWKYTDLITILTYLRTDINWEIFLFTSPPYLASRRYTDYIRLVQIYPIVQEGF